MAAPVTIYVPIHGSAGPPGGAAVRPVDPARRADAEHTFARGTAPIADLARKTREAAEQARAIIEHGGSPRQLGEDRPGHTLMGAFVRGPAALGLTENGRAAADFVYRTVDEFGPSRLGRGFLFDVEV